MNHHLDFYQHLLLLLILLVFVCLINSRICSLYSDSIVSCFRVLLAAPFFCYARCSLFLLALLHASAVGLFQLYMWCCGLFCFACAAVRAFTIAHLQHVHVNVPRRSNSVTIGCGQQIQDPQTKETSESGERTNHAVGRKGSCCPVSH